MAAASSPDPAKFSSIEVSWPSLALPSCDAEADAVGEAEEVVEVSAGSDSAAEFSCPAPELSLTTPNFKCYLVYVFSRKVVNSSLASS